MNLWTTHRLIILGCGLLLNLTSRADQGQNAEADEVLVTNQASALYFVENQGQLRDQYQQFRTDIDAKLETGHGLVIFIGRKGLHYQWTENINQNPDQSPDAPFGGGNINAYRMDVKLLGANMQHAILEKRDKHEYFERYYGGWTGEEGVVAHAYQKLIYRDVYPNIDWILYTDGENLKYDFLVRPGGDPSIIQLNYEGATSLKVENGALMAATPMGVVVESEPYSYETATQRNIPCSFKVHENTVQFFVAPYHGELVIDPALQWTTYYGGTEDERLREVAVDGNNFVYAAGTTSSSANIATTGAFQTTFRILRTPTMLVKFNEQGQRLWGTYYGEGSEYHHEAKANRRIAFDKDNNIYIGGIVNDSNGIATTGAHQTSFGGGDADIFIAKFNGSGQRLWGTYYGGSGDEGHCRTVISGFFDLCSDDSGNVYFVSCTNSSSAIATAGSHQSMIAGASDGFLVKLDSAGLLQWGTYFGGPDNDDLVGITTDGNGNIYIVGGTSSSTGIATTGAHQTTYGGTTLSSIQHDIGDGLLAKFSSSGSLIWATYYGGSDLDHCLSVTTDTAGNPYICGITYSSDGIRTQGASVPTTPVRHRLFLARFNSMGVRQWGSYLGDGIVPGLAFDRFNVAKRLKMGANNLYLAGTVNGMGGIATPGAFQTTIGGTIDAFIAKISLDGNLLWGTYFGGTELDRGHGVAYSNGSLYLAGETNSFGLGTPGAHQPNPTLLTPASSFLEGFITKFGMDTVAYFNQPFADTSICVGDSIHIPFQVSLSFEGNNSFILQLSNSAGSFANPTNLATLNTNTSDTFHTIIPAGTQNGDGYRLRMVSSHPAQISKDNMIDIRITAYPDTPIVTTNSPVCEGSNLNLNAHSTTPGVTYHWQGPNAFSSYAPNPFITSATSVNAGNYTVQATLHGCTVQQTASVTVNPVPATPSAGSNSPVCAGAELILTASSGTPGVSYQWYGPNGYTSTLQNPKIDPVQAKDSGDYQVIALLHGCPSDTGTTHVTVTTVSSAGIYVSPNDTLCVGGAARFVVMPQNVGINPQVQWYINGNAINGATGYVFSTTNLKDGDSVYCQIKVVGVCIEDLNIYTSGIKMTILPGTTVKPKVTITSLPQNPKPDEFVTFTAVGSHGGAIPQFQWQRDGVDVPGAVNGTYSTNDLAPWEQIRCIYTSNDICANPKSDTSNVIVANFPQSVGEMNTAGFQLFPNPNKGSFILQGTFTSHLVTIEVFNTVGQSVYQRNARPIKDQVKIDIGTSLPKGEYLLKIKEEDRISQMRFLVME